MQARAQTPLTAGFTYQGLLKSGGAAYTGSADLRFTIYDAAAGGSVIGSTQVFNAVTVTDGTFSVWIDLGMPAFNGDRRWAAIEVHTPSNGGLGPYTLLSPRQELSAVPYALRAVNATISGPQPNSVQFSNAANNFTGQSLDIDGSTLHVDAANNRVGIGVLAPSHTLTVAATANQYAMRLIGPYGTFQHGARLNFGDGDYAFIDEYVDDGLHLHANHLLITTDTTGNNAVYLPAGSVSAAEMHNEPGLTHLRQWTTVIPLTGSYASTVSSTINCPDSGFIIATFTTEYSTAGIGSGIQLDILPIAQDFTSFPFTLPGNTVSLATVHRVLIVEAAGPQTFHVLARGTGGPPVMSSLSRPALTLLYVPTAYGNVDQ